MRGRWRGEENSEGQGKGGAWFEKGREETRRIGGVDKGAE